MSVDVVNKGNCAYRGCNEPGRVLRGTASEFPVSYCNLHAIEAAALFDTPKSSTTTNG